MEHPKKRQPRKSFSAETLEAVKNAMQKRIDTPPPPAERTFSQKEIVREASAEIRKALAAGHRLEDIISDLKGLGLGLTLGSMKSYLKTARKPAQRKKTEGPQQAAQPAAKAASVQDVKRTAVGSKKGAFVATSDTQEI